MLIKDKSPVLSSEITDKVIFTQRRKIIKLAAGMAVASFIPDTVSATIKKTLRFLAARIRPPYKLPILKM